MSAEELQLPKGVCVAVGVFKMSVAVSRTVVGVFVDSVIEVLNGAGEGETPVLAVHPKNKTGKRNMSLIIFFMLSLKDNIAEWGQNR
jgi:hypothetical protein